MTAFTSAFPRKSSRTSTQAVIVPSTALSSATTSDVPSVSLSAATASGLVTASQNAARAVLRRLADERGDREHHDQRRYVVTMPRDRAVPALSPCIRSVWTRAQPCSDGKLGMSRQRLTRQPVTPPTCRSIRAITPVLGSKKRFCTLSQPPSPSWSIVNWPGRAGNFFVSPASTLVDRPVAVVGEDLLRRRRPQEAEERVRRVPCSRCLQHRDRVLDQDRRARDHVLRPWLRERATIASFS